MLQGFWLHWQRFALTLSAFFLVHDVNADENIRMYSEVQRPFFSHADKTEDKVTHKHAATVGVYTEGLEKHLKGADRIW